MNKLWLAPCVALLFLLGRDTPRARACGGPATYQPYVVGVPRLLEEDVDSPRDELRFLYPFLLAQPSRAKALWDFSYGDLTRVPGPDPTAMNAAIRAQDFARAEAEALALVNSWYEIPPVLAAAHRPVLEHAVAFLESYPLLNKLSIAQAAALPEPHRPSRQFSELLRQSAARIPNGWSGTQKQAPQVAVFADLLGQSRAWLSANPKHPLRDLVTLWQVRLHYFAGDNEAAWATLFRIYPQRPVRAVAEMRFLTQQGRAPSPAQLEALRDPLLIALLADSQTITSPRWTRWWRLSEQAPALPRLALQQRLLGMASSLQPLPESFPENPAQNGQYWGKLRALSLMHHTRWEEARAQLLLLAPEPEQANLIARCYVGLGQPELAARVQQLDPTELEYVVAVLVPEAKLSTLRTAKPPVASEAQVAEEVAALGRDDLPGAAAIIQSANAEEAGALKQMAVLAQRGDQLSLARAFNERAESLGWGEDHGFYRGLSDRYTALDPTSGEARAIQHFFEAGSGRFHALRAYVAWLEAHAQSASARQVLAEADRTYMVMTSYGGGPGLFWDSYFKHHDLASRLRQVGKLIRARSPR